MRYLVGFLCACALGVVPMAGCGSGFVCERNVCSCSEEGVRAAIAAGGSHPYTFDCNGPTTLAARFVIDNDVILDGGGELTVDGFDVGAWWGSPTASGVIAELHGFEMTDQSIWADRGGIEKSATLLISDSSIVGFSGRGVWNHGTLALMNTIVGGCLQGGVGNFGTLTITDSVISSNFTGDFTSGGTGVYNSGALTIIRSTISENHNYFSFDGGAGIYNSGTLTVVDSTVSRNRETGEAHGGSGIHNDDDGTVTLTNCTVSENEASGPGGGIYNSGILKMTNATVSGNTAPEASAVYSDGTATSANSLIHGDCGGLAAVISNGYNIESPGDTCGFDQQTDRVNVSTDDLALGPLADNGGPTKTHALEAGSVAIDKIPADMCEVDEDQRGEPRPAGTESKCDVGAFEAHP